MNSQNYNFYNNEFHENNCDSVFYILLKSTLFLTLAFIILEIGADIKTIQEILPSLNLDFLVPIKISTFCLTLSCIIYLIGLPLRENRKIFNPYRALKSTMPPIKNIIFFILLYLAFDLMSLSYTNYPNLALPKYFTSISMAILLILSSVYINTKDGDNKTNVFLIIFAISSLLLAVSAFLYFFIKGETYFTRRLSLINNYNKFAFSIIFGFYSALYYLFRSNTEYRKRNLAILIISVICISAIYLSGSRRCHFMLKLTLPVIYLYGFIDVLLFYKDDLKNNFTHLMEYIISISLIFLLTIGIIWMYNSKTTKYSEKLAKENPGIENLIASRDVNTILKDENSMDKRDTLWRIARESFQNFDTQQEKIIGRGASYHFEIYDFEENKNLIEDMYQRKLGTLDTHPHNFLFVDLLDGGYAKVCITLLMLLSALIFIFKLLKISTVDTIFLLIFSIILLGDMFLEVRNGILDYKFLWLMLLLFISISHEFNIFNKRKVIK